MIKGKIVEVYEPKGQGAYEYRKVVLLGEDEVYYVLRLYDYYKNIADQNAIGLDAVADYQVLGNKWEKEDGEIIYFSFLKATTFKVMGSIFDSNEERPENETIKYDDDLPF